jgi:CheY-like chemotaxis protein
LTLRLDLPEKKDSHPLTVDPELFKKLIEHLLDNALKFTRSGLITFGMREDDRHLHFFVNDTGVGIKPENHEMIFKPFSQEDSSETRGYEGNGLGLAIVQGIAKLLGGSIQVKSEKDKGATFSFSIPKVKSTPAETTINQRKVDDAAGGRQMLLIAEDDYASFKYFDVLFSRLQIDLLHAKNGQEAVDLCRNHPEIQLVLMDIKMPVMNGYEATKIIKQFRPKLPIIAQTAFALSGDEHQAREAGCDDYLPKPITKKTLVAKLEQFGITFSPIQNKMNT